MKTKKIWCKHIKWEPSFVYWKCYTWYFNDDYLVDRTWKCCPICQTPRPRKLTKLEKIQQQRSEYGVYQ